MIFQIIYLVGNQVKANPKLRKAPLSVMACKGGNAEHTAEIEAENAHCAIKNFRKEHPEAKIFICTKK